MPSDYYRVYVYQVWRGQTDRQTEATKRPTHHAGGYTASAGNE